MNQHISSSLEIPSLINNYVGVTPGADPLILAHIYPDGDMWGVMIGHNGQDGVCGYGTTISEALRDLANSVEGVDNE